MFTGLTVRRLVNCLTGVPPVDLQAVSLLDAARQNMVTGGAPQAVPPEQVAAATSEIIAYTQACAALLNKLTYLSPIILPQVECPAWPL